MQRAAVEAEHAWTRQQFWKAIGMYQHAVDMGSPYGRTRLGWILATTQELLDAQEAIALLAPEKDRDSNHVASALAAAYAAGWTSTPPWKKQPAHAAWPDRDRRKARNACPARKDSTWCL